MNIRSNHHSVSLLLVTILNYISTSTLPDCGWSDIKYQFTDCDDGGRWRILTPIYPGRCTGGLLKNNSFIHVDGCYTSCEAGRFYNISTMLCENCDPGHYSLGGGIIFEKFENSLGQLPEGFHIKTDFTDDNLQSAKKCNGWFVDKTTKNLVSSIQINSNESDIESSCVSSVTYAAKVVKRGRFRFIYSYQTPDDVSSSIVFTFNFRFYDSTGSVDDNIGSNIKFLTPTEKNNFEVITVPLNYPGFYVFTWKSVLIGKFHAFTSLISGMRNNFYSENLAKSTQDGEFSKKLVSNGMIRIKEIIIEGVAFASECTACRPGTFAMKPGASECLLCPPNTAFAGFGAIQCSKCDSINEYAPKGSVRCFKRPICGPNDFYNVSKACDLKTSQREIEFKWIEPRICVDLKNVFPKKNLIINCNSTTQNNSNELQDLCDLGMEIKSFDNIKFCQFCPEGQYRDENRDHCERCPPFTTPYYVLSIHYWNISLPGWSGTAPLSIFSKNTSFYENNFFEDQLFLNSFLSRQCLKSDEEYYSITKDENPVSMDKIFVGDGGECVDEVAWQPFYNYIRTGPSTPLNAFSILSIIIPAFRSNDNSEINFVFEVYCEKDDKCQFLFVETLRPSENDFHIQELTEKDFSLYKKKFSFFQKNINQVIQEWEQSTSGKTSFRFSINRNMSLVYSWIFKRSSSFQSFAKIHTLEVINSVVGSAIKCKNCSILNESSQNCISCPFGQFIKIKKNYIQSNDSFLQPVSISSNFECRRCPVNFILNTSISLPIDEKSCVSCGENLVSENETNDCINDCHVVFDKDHYDLREIHQPILYKGVNLFTAGGTAYMHLFKISLCGHKKRNSLSTCLNNITTFIDESSASTSGVQSFVCRSTILPDESQLFATQSISLGDELIAISRNSTYRNTSVHEDFLKGPEVNKYDNDFHLYFLTKAPTNACPFGRKLTITMRCIPGIEKTNDGKPVVLSPSSCPDGTCNGCDFHLLIKTGTAAACRLCQPYSNDYDTLVGECIENEQQIHYINPKNCVIKMEHDFNGGKASYVLTRSCSVLLPKQVQIGITLAIALGLFLLLLVFYFWNKNRSLEYKYTKLIESAGDSKGNDDFSLDNCCVEDGENESINDNIIEDNSRLSFSYIAQAKNANESRSTKKLSQNRSRNRANVGNTNHQFVSDTHEIQHLFDNCQTDFSKPKNSVDDEGYETIHLISANKNSIAT